MTLAVQEGALFYYSLFSRPLWTYLLEALHVKYKVQQYYAWLIQSALVCFSAYHHMLLFLCSLPHVTQKY